MVAVEPTYCHQCGAQLDEQPIHGRRRKVCPDCGFRHFRNAVPAVNVIVRDGRDVLLMDPVEGDRWELPGGHPEVDEEPAAAAARELAEETGVEAPVAELALLSVVHTTHRDKHYNMVTYVVEDAATGGRVAPGAEAAAVEFWPLERILSSPTETRQVDRRVLKRAFDG